MRIIQNSQIFFGFISCALHFLDHEFTQFAFIHIKLVLKVSGDMICHFTTVDIQAPFWNIFNFVFYVLIPFGELLNLLFNLIESDLSLFPIGHLEGRKKSKYFSDNLVVIIDVI